MTRTIVANTTVVSLVAGIVLAVAAAPASRAADDEWRSMPDVLSASTAGDWRTIEPENLLYMELADGTVIMELAPQFAPRHLANLRELIDAGHFRPGSIKRVQDNYVVQWSGDGPFGDAGPTLEPEFLRSARDLPFTRLDADDAYAAEVGFADGFPAGRSGPDGNAWLAHCYGMLGVGRAVAADSGNSAELYVVIGHAPRHLDRNVTLIGRVISGIELLSTLPRGGGALGFYGNKDDYVAIRSFRFGTDYDPGWQVLRTDTATFAALVESRRWRHEDWFVDPAGAIGLCNVPLPARRVD